MAAAKKLATLSVLVVDDKGVKTTIELVQDKETPKMMRFSVKANTLGVVGSIYQPR